MSLNGRQNDSGFGLLTYWYLCYVDKNICWMPIFLIYANEVKNRLATSQRSFGCLIFKADVTLPMFR